MHVRPIFEAADRFEKVVEDLQKVGRYELRIGATKMFARFLMSTITSFEESHPEATVILRDSTSEEAAKGVETLAFHLAVVGRQTYSPQVRSKCLRHVDFILTVRPSHPFAGRREVGWKELDGQPFVLREPGSGAGRALHERFAAYNVTPAVALETGSLELTKRYAAERGALAFFFEPDIRAELESGRLVEIPLREGPLTMELDIVYPPNVYRSPAVRAFFAALEEAADADWSILPEAARHPRN